MRFILDKVVAEQVILPVLLVSPVIIISPMLHAYIHLHAAATGRTNGRSLGTSNKQCSFEIGERWTVQFSHSGLRVDLMASVVCGPELCLLL